MKKILIVNNNLDMGGIQKSLINLLKVLHDKYEITLLLFSCSGALLADVPDDVKIVTPCSWYRILGMSRDELKKLPLLFMVKAVLMECAKLFSRRAAMKLLGLFQKRICGYDTVISYSHLTNSKVFANGCGDFVLDKTDCSNKVCIIHCDYLNSGFMSEQNNAEYAEFNKIACCSDSVKSRFIQGSQVNEDRVYTLRNFFDLDIVGLAEDNAFCFDSRNINLVSVARLSPEKGIDRVIEALHSTNRADIKYYIVGDGPQRKALEEKVNEYNMENQVLFVGEQKNPYKYMINADYLIVPSLHEAAPIVFDEAKILGVKVITTNTTSATEMIGKKGIVCDNSQAGIDEVLSGLTKSLKNEQGEVTNQLQSEQLKKVIEN